MTSSVILHSVILHFCFDSTVAGVFFYRRRFEMKSVILRCGFSGALLLASGLAVAAQEMAKHPISFDDMIKLHRIAEPHVSPDGKWVAYTVSTPDMEANRGVSNIWVVPTGGGAAMQLTQSGHDSSPVWSPDGKTLAFLSSRNGDSQVYLLSMEGGEAHPLTKLSTGADFVKWSPDGKTIAFTSSVFPDCKDDGCNKKRNDEKEKNRVKAHVAENLLYRHWTHWNEGPRAHLFVMPSNENLSEAFDRSATNLAWSRDSKTIFFLAENETEQPVYAIAPAAGATPKKIVNGFNAAFALSEDGKTLSLTRTNLTLPSEIFVSASYGTGLRQVTHTNEALLAKLEMNAPENFLFEGAEGQSVQAMLILPSDFDAMLK